MTKHYEPTGWVKQEKDREYDLPHYNLDIKDDCTPQEAAALGMLMAHFSLPWRAWKVPFKLYVSTEQNDKMIALCMRHLK